MSNIKSWMVTAAQKEYLKYLRMDSPTIKKHAQSVISETPGVSEYMKYKHNYVTYGHV